MAIVGQRLLAPESGYTRYPFTDLNFTYSKGWSNNGGHDMISVIIGDTIKFNFYGESIYVIVHSWNNRGKMSISIDGKEPILYNGNQGVDINDYVAFVANDLEKKWHDVSITVLSTLGTLRAIDVKGDIAPYNKNVREETRMILKNPSTSQAYSIEEKTLIQLPSSSNQNMISYGIEKGKKIQLDIPFDKVKLVKDSSEALGEGKTFSHAINLSELKTKRIIL